MKILLTGGAGFIGSNVADAYLEAGHQVIIVDNLSTGKKQNIPAKARFHKVDICDLEKLETVFEEERPDVINHHAAQIDVRISLNAPQQDAGVNILGGINLLELARKYNVSRIVYASTGGALYGETPGKPAAENSPIHSPSHYGVSKYTLENYLHLYARLYNLNHTILRYANVYGPRQNPLGEAGVVAIFIHRILESETPVIYGDGEQFRDYVFVGDVAQANLAALKAQPLSTFNVGSGVVTSVNRLFALLKKELGFKGEAQYAPPRPGEIIQSALDIALAKKVLGWQPEVSLAQGLEKTVAWQKALKYI